MNKTIEWTQNTNEVQIQYVIKRSSKQKINVEVFPCFVKVQIVERNWISFIDLCERVEFKGVADYDYANDTLHINLKKERKGIWDSLEVEKLSKEELRERRTKAMAEKEEHIKQQQEKTAKIKEEISRKAFENRLDQEKEFKHEIEKRKEDEKKRVIDELLQVDEDKKEVFEESLVNQSEIEYYKHKKTDNSQFSIRQTQDKTVKLNFTKKVYPHLAMREKYLFEPPKPKKTEHSKEEDAVDFLWLKNKGDEFLKNKDYHSALRAYDEAIKAKKDFLPCIANKSLVFLKQGHFETSLNVVDMFLELYEGLSPNEQNFTNNKKLKEMMVKRKVFILLNLGRTGEGLSLLKKIKEESVCVISEDNKEELEKFEDNLKRNEDDIRKIEARLESNKSKEMGDRAFLVKNYEKAESHYKTALETDNDNERVLSNISQIKAKIGNEEDAIVILDQLEKRIEAYKQQFDCLDNESNLKSFLIKIYMRKIEYLKKNKQVELIEEYCKKLLKLRQGDKFALKSLKYIQTMKDKEEYFELKNQFTNHIKQSDFRQGLKVLKKGQTLLNIEEDPVEFLCLCLNKMICYNKLNSHYETIGEALKGLKIIKNLENNLINKELRSKYEKGKEKIKKIQLRLYLRRANAFLQTGQRVSAREDLEKAKKIDSEDKEIKRMLDILVN